MRQETETLVAELGSVTLYPAVAPGATVAVDVGITGAKEVEFAESISNCTVFEVPPGDGFWTLRATVPALVIAEDGI